MGVARANRAGGGGLTQSGAERWKDKLNTFLGAHKEKAKREKAEDKTQANVHSLVAFDHALTGTLGIGLRRFLPLRRPRALGPGEERFYVDAADLPDEVRDSADRDRRACISAPGNETYLEVVWGPRPTLQVHLDMSDKQWHGRTWLFTEVVHGQRPHPRTQKHPPMSRFFSQLLAIAWPGTFRGWLIFVLCVLGVGCWLPRLGYEESNGRIGRTAGGTTSSCVSTKWGCPRSRSSGPCA